MGESRLEESIGRTVRYVNDKAETVESVVADADGPCAQELLVHVNLTEPTDALGALDYSELSTRVDACSEAQGEAARREEATAHEVSEEQRTVQEELSEKDRDVQRMKARLEQLTRMREEYRVWSESQLEDARQTAEAVEDAVRNAAMGTAAPSLREAAEVDDLRLQLNEAQSRLESDRAIMEEKIRREQDAREQHELNVQKEMQVALDSMEQLREDVEKRVAEIG